MNLQTLKQAIARVTVEAKTGGPSYGTAFYVGEKYAISALHVVAEFNGSTPRFFVEQPGDLSDSFPQGIELDFTELGHRTLAKVLIWDSKNDWVVLECEESPQTAPIECGGGARKGDVWESFGYPEIHSTGLNIKGDLSDPHLKSGDAIVLQLSWDQGQGAGPPLHGFSGAPCLVDGKAVGLLRSSVVGDRPDGRLQPKLYTEGGFVFACRSEDIVNRKPDLRRILLPNGWSLPYTADDFVVFLSQEEHRAKPRLESVVNTAYEGFLKNLNVAEPYFMFAGEVISSEQGFEHAVRLLCRARVVVFDATAFEPAVMVLMGVRAVVRRGVTILSVGRVGDEEFALGKELDMPFNITDANIVAHSEEQNKIKPTSVQLLTARVRRGLKEIDSPYYLDLPVFEAIRKLPEERRGVRAKKEGALVLCSFDSDYTEHNWKRRLKVGLENQLERYRGETPLKSGDLGVARSFELNSPRLVTQAVYEEMRRAQACIVDLTNWEPSVLFELGVRLAASKEPTVCMLAMDCPYPKGKEKWKEQCENLTSLFDRETNYHYDPGKSFEEDDAYKNAYGPDSIRPQGPASGSIHNLVENELDVSAEPASRPVYRELLESAELFARVPGPGGETKPVGLFPGNEELPRREEEADFERLVATWFYLCNRYPEEQIFDNYDIRAAASDTIAALLSRHSTEGTAKLDDFPDLLQALGKMRKKIKDLGG